MLKHRSPSLPFFALSYAFLRRDADTQSLVGPAFFKKVIKKVTKSFDFVIFVVEAH